MDSLKQLLDTIDSIKEKITNQEYLELCNQARKVYDYLNYEQKTHIIFVPDNFNTENELVEIESEEDVSESELEQIEQELDNECVCTQNEFLCFTNPSLRCNNYQTILQYCPPLARKFDSNAPKYKLPKTITEITENPLDATKCIRYMLNSFSIHNSTPEDKMNGIVMCVLITLLHFNPEYNIKRYLQILNKKIIESLEGYEKFKDSCKPILEHYYDTTSEETIEIIKGWYDNVNQKIEILDFMNMQY